MTKHLYQVGDTVILNQKRGTYSRHKNGEIFKILSQESCNDYNYYKLSRVNDGETLSAYEEDLEKQINNKINKNMNLLQKIKLNLKKEPTKTFIQAGILDQDDNFTVDGKEVFLNYLLDKNGADFKKTVVDPIIEADKEN